MEHDLKSWPVNFAELKRGRTLDVRRNDRNFALGDHVTFREWLPHQAQYTGATLTFRILDLVPIPGEPHHGTRRMVLHLEPVRTVNVQVESAPPPHREEEPELVLWARVLDSNRVMQVLEDERGERHQVFGRYMSPAAVVGDGGKLLIYPAGKKQFQRNTCSCFSGGSNTWPVANGACTGCGMPTQFQNRGTQP